MAEGASSCTGTFSGIPLVSPSSGPCWTTLGLATAQLGYIRQRLGRVLSAEVAAPSMDGKASCPRVNPLCGHALLAEPLKTSASQPFCLQAQLSSRTSASATPGLRLQHVSRVWFPPLALSVIAGSLCKLWNTETRPQPRCQFFFLTPNTMQMNA